MEKNEDVLTNKASERNRNQNCMVNDVMSSII